MFLLYQFKIRVQSIDKEKKLYSSLGEMAAGLWMGGLQKCLLSQKTNFIEACNSILYGGIDGDVTINFNAASEFLVGFNFMNLFDEGVRVHI